LRRAPSFPKIPVLAEIAQLVERVIRNDEVVGSIPIFGTTIPPELPSSGPGGTKKPADAGFFVPAIR
jgi:hypothetical protein